MQNMKSIVGPKCAVQVFGKHTAVGILMQIHSHGKKLVAEKIFAIKGSA